jgi:hypothetical protein
MALLLSKELAERIESGPDPMDSQKFLEWNHLYLLRRAASYTSRKVDTRSDEIYVKFQGSIIQDLLAQAESNDLIVFRFICNPLEDNFSGLNITPVIMDEGLTTIKVFSDVKGDGLPLNKPTKSFTDNYDVRKMLLENTEGFKHETCGISYTAKEFKTVFENTSEFSIYFMFDHFSKVRPKTSIALLPFDRRLLETPDHDLIRTLKLYDNGGECC